MTSKPDPVVEIIARAIDPQSWRHISMDGIEISKVNAQSVLAALEAAGLRVLSSENVTALIKAAEAELDSAGAHTHTRVELNTALIPFRDIPEQSDD